MKFIKNPVVKAVINQPLHAMVFLFAKITWSLNYPYSEEWDSKLNEILDECESDKIKYCLDTNYFTLVIDSPDCEIWLRNRWHAFGHLFSTKYDSDIWRLIYKRPKFCTMVRLKNFVESKFGPIPK